MKELLLNEKSLDGQYQRGFLSRLEYIRQRFLDGRISWRIAFLTIKAINLLLQNTMCLPKGISQIRTLTNSGVVSIHRYGVSVIEKANSFLYYGLSGITGIVIMGKGAAGGCTFYLPFHTLRATISSKQNHLT